MGTDDRLGHRPEDLTVEATVLDHLLRRDHHSEPVAVESLLAELAGEGNVESALVRLCDSGILEVVPDARVVLSESAVHFGHVMRYMSRQ